MTFGVKWNLQAKYVLSELGNLFNGKEDDLEEISTDVTLFSSDGECVHVHRFVLMLCSPYFKRMFSQINKKGKSYTSNTIVLLNNVRIEILRNFVQFIYTGEVNLTTEQEQKEFEEIVGYFGIVGLSKNARFGGDDVENGQTVKSKLSKGEGECGTVELPENIDLKVDSVSNKESSLKDSLTNKLPRHSEEEKKNVATRTNAVVKMDKSKKSLRNRCHVSAPKSKQSSQSAQYLKTAKLHSWTRIQPLSEPILKKDWTPRKTFKIANNLFQVFNCSCGEIRCQATLKIKTLPDGTCIYLRNGYQHASHKNKLANKPELKRSQKFKKKLSDNDNGSQSNKRARHSNLHNGQQNAFGASSLENSSSSSSIHFNIPAIPFQPDIHNLPRYY